MKVLLTDYQYDNQAGSLTFPSYQSKGMRLEGFLIVANLGFANDSTHSIVYNFATDTSPNSGLAAIVEMNVFSCEGLRFLNPQSTFLVFYEDTSLDGNPHDDSSNLNYISSSVAASADSLVQVYTQLTTLLSATNTTNNKLDTLHSDNANVNATNSANGVKIDAQTAVVSLLKDSIVLLRRLVKLSETLAVTDSGQRQRVAIDALASGMTLSNITTLNQIASVDARYYLADTARGAYATGIRSNLKSS